MHVHHAHVFCTLCFWLWSSFLRPRHRVRPWEGELCVFLTRGLVGSGKQYSSTKRESPVTKWAVISPRCPPPHSRLQSLHTQVTKPQIRKPHTSAKYSALHCKQHSFCYCRTANVNASTIHAGSLGLIHTVLKIVTTYIVIDIMSFIKVIMLSLFVTGLKPFIYIRCVSQ